MNSNQKIITRFAPSPTGELHVGGARTALFSYLFAKSKGGQFLLRIEDTDQERFVEGSVERIINSLSWLGIKVDNDKPMIQSERLDIYKKYASKLLSDGKAYICTCSKERLEKLREEQKKRGEAPRYDGKCRAKSQAIRNKIQTNHKSQITNHQTDNKESITNQLQTGSVIRMKMPQSGEIVVNDLVRGKVKFDVKLLDDQIIIKSDGYPTYHLASVIDDHEMNITHVIRAEEWLSSTPKHLVLYEAFGWKAPAFAHLPMILGPDKKKLSKRHGATSIKEYKKEGYLPEALVNFMAFLGWNPKDEREDFTLDELIKEFKLENVNKSSAVFDVNKLDDINSEKLRILEIKKLRSMLENFKLSNISNGELEIVQRGGYKTLKEAANYILKLRKEPQYEAELLIFKKSDKVNTKKGLEAALNVLEGISDEDWNVDNVQNKLSDMVGENNLSNGDVFWPVRVALSGAEKSPSPVELAVALGRDESLKRIDSATRKLG